MQPLTSRVLLAFAGAGVEDFEGAVGGDGEAEIVAVGVAFAVGDVFGGDVVGGVGGLGVVELPEVFETGCVVDGLPGGCGAAFGAAVVHDGEARGEAIDEGGAVAVVPAVVGDDVDVGVAEQVAWAHQLALLIPGEVAEVDEGGFGEADDDAERAWVFGLVGGTDLGLGAGGIGLTSAGKGLGEELAVDGDDLDVETGDGEGVTEMGDEALGGVRGGEDFLVGGVDGVGVGVGLFAVDAVVDEGADGDAGEQLGDAADVVLVEVGDEDVVDAGEAGAVSGGDDAVGVAAVIAGPAGVDEQRVVVGG